jgi:hypothetical protein
LVPGADGEAGFGAEEALQGPRARAGFARQIGQSYSCVGLGARASGCPDGAWIAWHREIERGDWEHRQFVEEHIDHVMFGRRAAVERFETHRVEQELAQER